MYFITDNIQSSDGLLSQVAFIYHIVYWSFPLLTEKALVKMLSPSPSCVQWKVMASCSGMWLVFCYHITTLFFFHCSDIDDVMFQYHVLPFHCTLINLFGIQLKHFWKSLVSFGICSNLQKFSKKVQKCLYGLLTTLENFPKSPEGSRKSSEYLQTIVISMLQRTCTSIRNTVEAKWGQPVSFILEVLYQFSK